MTDFLRFRTPNSALRILSRRDWLARTGCGFGGLALAGLAARAAETKNPLAAKTPHFAPKVKRVIFLFMQGGVSHVDSYDHKPRLFKDDGKQFPFDDARVLANTGARGSTQRVMKPMWEFARHGQSGRWGSALFPERIKTSTTSASSTRCKPKGWLTARPRSSSIAARPVSSAPVWGRGVLYGLGSENENLPGFVSIAPSSGNGGARNYGPAFLPAVYQGTPLGKAGAPAAETVIRNLKGAGPAPLELLRELHVEQLKRRPGDAELEAVAQSFELAGRMQTHAPDVLDLSKETGETKALYGIDEQATDSFGRQCLSARRLYLIGSEAVP